MTDLRINLTDSGSRTPPLAVGSNNRVSIQVKATTWSTAVVDLEWSLDLEQWDVFASAVQLSTSTTGKRNVNIDATAYIRLKTSTAATGATADAEATMILYRVAV